MVLSGLTLQPSSERDIMRSLDLEAERSEHTTSASDADAEETSLQEMPGGSFHSASAAAHGTLAQPNQTNSVSGRFSQQSSDLQRYQPQENGPDQSRARLGDQSSQAQVVPGKTTPASAASGIAGFGQDGLTQGHNERTGENHLGNSHGSTASSSQAGRSADQLAALSQIASNAQTANKLVANSGGNSYGSAMVGVGSAGRQQSSLASTVSRQAPTPQSGRGASAEAALHAQLSRGLAQAMRSGEGTATIRLDPQHMGSLRVDVTVREGFVEAIFRPSTVEAQRLLEADSSALEQALHTRGLRVDRIEIRPAHESAVPTQMFEAPPHDTAMDGERGDAEQQGTADSRHANGGRGSGTHREQGDETAGAGGTLKADHGTEMPESASLAAESADTIQTRAEPGGLWSSIDTIA